MPTDEPTSNESELQDPRLRYRLNKYSMHGDPIQPSTIIRNLHVSDTEFSYLTRHMTRSVKYAVHLWLGITLVSLTALITFAALGKTNAWIWTIWLSAVGVLYIIMKCMMDPELRTLLVESGICGACGAELPSSGEDRPVEIRCDSCHAEWRAR